RFFIQEHVRGPAAKDIGLVYCCLRALSSTCDGIRVTLPRSIPSEIAPTKKRRVRPQSYLFTIGQRDTTSVNIQPTCAPLEHVLRHRRFRQWLPCEDDWLDGGLQSGAPAFPLFRLGSGGGGHCGYKNAPVILYPRTSLVLVRSRYHPFHRFAFCNYHSLRPELLVNRLA